MTHLITLTTIRPLDIKPAWDWYVETFTPIQRRAVLQHMLSEAAFTEACCDPRITKHLVLDDLGVIVGMAMVTKDLDAQHCAAPEYFEHQHPDLYRRQAIWYVIFVGASRIAGAHIFRQILTALRKPVAAARPALCIVDFCNVNDSWMPDATRTIMQDLAVPGVTIGMSRLDQQNFWAVDPGGDYL